MSEPISKQEKISLPPACTVDLVVNPHLATVIQDADCRLDEVLLAVKADMGPDGSFCERWFVVSQDRIFVFLNDSSTVADGLMSGNLQLEESYSIQDLKELRFQSLVGGGVVEIIPVGRSQLSLEILRCSTAKERLFSAVINRIQKRKKAESKNEGDEAEKPLDPDDPEDPRNPLTFSDVIKKERDRICGSCGGPLAENTKVCPICISRGKTLMRILSFAGPFKWQLATLGSLMVLGTLVALIPPLLTRALIDDVLTPMENLSWIPWIVSGLAGVLVGNAVLGIVRGRLSVRVGAEVTGSIRAKAFHHLQALSLGYFNKQKTGQLMSRISNDTGRMQGFLTDGIQFTIINILQVIGIAAILLWLNPFLGLMVILPAPFVIILSKVIWRRIFVRFRKRWEAHGRLTALLNDVLNGVRVVKVFGKETHEINRFDGKNFELTDSTIRAEQFWQTWVPILTLTLAVGQVLVWYFGSHLVLEGKGLEIPVFTVGDLVAYLSYLGMLYGPLMLLARLNDWFANAMTSAERVFEVLDSIPDIVDKPDAKSVDRFKGDIEFEKVTFGYERHKPVLEEFSLDVKAGEMIGLVGKSGAGKSTTINLAARLYDVDEGSIRIDGTDMRDIAREDLHRQVGVVLQETFLFSGSIVENLGYASPKSCREEILRAAYAANAHDFIMNKPDAYDNEVGERGKNLSGGEKQRVSIARAILHDPRILILDEATSSVDTETEQKIQEAIRRLIQGRTTFAIAHRLSTLRDANRLVVLEKGKIVEVGTHAELMEKEDGVFRKLVNIQSEMNQAIAYQG